MNNKLNIPDDWAKDYESPVTVQIQKIAQQIEAQRENEITLKISEQIGVNVDKDELKRALAYDRDQYRRGYEAGWKACSENVPQWIPIIIRELTEEEKEEYPNCTFMYDCKLPEDGEEVLVTTWNGKVALDTFYHDDGCYFETYCDQEDVIAWRPLPEPCKEEGAE